MRTAIVLLLFTVPVSAQAKKDAPTAAEQKALADYEEALAAAADAYNAAVSKAHKRRYIVLEDELKAATKAGNFDRAVAIKERMKQHSESGAPTLAMGGVMKFPVGTWEIKYSNGATRTYQFAANGNAHYVGTDKRAKLVAKNGCFGLQFDVERFEIVHVLPNGIVIEHHHAATWPASRAPEIVAQGVRK